MDQTDLAIPEIKLIQNVGGDEAKQSGAVPGNFYFSMTGEVIPGDAGFDMVIVAPIQKTRTYWGRTEVDDEPPACASQDSIVSVNGDNCKNACPYQAFTDAPALIDATTRRTKCTPGYSILAIKLGDMMPMLLRCTGISAMAARELQTVLLFHKGIKGQTYKAKLHVSSIKKKTSSGEAYAIKFSAPQLIEDQAMLKDVQETSTLLTGIDVTQIETDDTKKPQQITQGEEQQQQEQQQNEQKTTEAPPLQF